MALNSAFFDAVRLWLFGGALKQSQVDGIDAIATAFVEYGDGDLRKLSYGFATKYREVGAEMVPKFESLNYITAARIREVWRSRFPTVASN